MAYNEKSLKKEHRKQWSNNKRVAKSCRNHGGCEYCRGNRTHKFRSKNEASKEQFKELSVAVDLLEDKYAWEFYCGSCDNLNTDDCPYKNKVDDLTYYPALKCKNFIN